MILPTQLFITWVLTQTDNENYRVFILDSQAAQMSGGSYATCDGCYEEIDIFGKTIFVMTDKSRFLAQQDDDVWACFGHQNLFNFPASGGAFVRSMYILPSYLVFYFNLILFAPSVEHYVVILGRVKDYTLVRL